MCDYCTCSDSKCPTHMERVFFAGQLLAFSQAEDAARGVVAVFKMSLIWLIPNHELTSVPNIPSALKDHHRATLVLSQHLPSYKQVQ